MRGLRLLPARPFHTLTHLLYHGEFSTFRRPRTFTQMIVAKKLFGRDPLMVATLDKLLVRDFVAARIGEQYLIPLLQVADSAEQLDFDSLEAPYVIKGRHGYNMTTFVREGEQPDRAKITRQSRQWLRTNIYSRWKEWAYRYCPAGLVVERMIGVDGEAPPDYKFIIFNGRVEIVQVDSTRFTEHRLNLFDRNWRSIRREGLYPPITPPPLRPVELDKMIELAERLGAGFDWVRVDLYNVEGRIYFGEITHYPGGGIVAQEPRALDEALAALYNDATPLPDDIYDEDADELAARLRQGSPQLRAG